MSRCAMVLALQCKNRSSGVISQHRSIIALSLSAEKTIIHPQSCLTLSLASTSRMRGDLNTHAIRFNGVLLGQRGKLT
jgi:hypothetical protein